MQSHCCGWHPWHGLEQPHPPLALMGVRPVEPLPPRQDGSAGAGPPRAWSPELTHELQLKCIYRVQSYVTDVNRLGAALTHGLELTDQLFFGPLLFVGPEGYAGGHHQLVVVGVGHVEVVHQNDVRVLYVKATRVTHKLTYSLTRNNITYKMLTRNKISSSQVHWKKL